MQQPILVMAGFDEAKGPSDCDFTYDIKGVELHPGEQVECLPLFRKIGHCSHELAIDPVDKGLVHDQRAHRVQVGGLPALHGMFRIAPFREEIFVSFVEAAKRAVEFGLAEFRTGTIDGADG
jgi:hypothetical protein